MSLVVPDAAEVRILQAFLANPLSLRLYSNNYTPIATSVAASFTEVAGGGYAAKALILAGWAFTANAPSFGQYAIQAWNFTGATNAPGTIYGYFVTRDSDGLLMWAERLPAISIPVTPILGTLLQITPRFTAGSVY